MRYWICVLVCLGCARVWASSNESMIPKENLEAIQDDDEDANNLALNKKGDCGCSKGKGNGKGNG